jgi:hypothetical protein
MEALATDFGIWSLTHTDTNTHTGTNTTTGTDTDTHTNIDADANTNILHAGRRFHTAGRTDRFIHGGLSHGLWDLEPHPHLYGY